MEQRIEAIIRQMTREEKINCAACFDDRIGNISRLGIPGYYTCDNASIDYGGGKDYMRRTPKEKEEMGGFWGTCLPQAAVLGNSWDNNLAYQTADTLAQEAKYGNVGVLLRPGCNIVRSPLCGRNFEYFSEDPVLAGELAGSYIQGVQKNNVAACLKHFAVNSQEFERMTTNAVVSDRALQELYLRVFDIAIQKGRPWTMMTSYNRVNGSYAQSNREIMGILRKQFGYDGLIMSDCMAVHYDKIEAHNAGQDVELDDVSIHEDQISDALDNGTLSEERLNEIVRRCLEVYFKITEGAEIPTEIDFKAHHAVAVRAAEQGAVLLKNDGILPLDPKEKQTIAVIGQFAKTPSYMGGGSGHMNGITIDAGYDAICAIAGKNADILYADGYDILTGFPPKDTVNEEKINEAVKLAAKADKVIFFTGYDYGVESEGYDRPDMRLPAAHRALLEKMLAAKCNVILILNTGAPVELAEYAGRVRAILYSGYCGEGCGSSAANILFGLAEPGGRLAVTFPLRLEDTPAYLNFPNYPDASHDVLYGEDIYVGYRWYDARKMDVLYPFGYGLSYTSFAYENLRLSAKEMHADGELTVSLTVKNTGSRAGSDVLQLYLYNRDHTINLPPKQLKAFQKVFLKPGESKEVTLTLGRKQLEIYAPAMKKWVVEPGCYDIMVGRSSRDIVLEDTVQVHSSECAYGYDMHAGSAWIVRDKNFAKAAEEKLTPQAANYFATAPMASLVEGLPWSRLTEVDVGQGKTSLKELYAVVKRLEELRAREETK